MPPPFRLSHQSAKRQLMEEIEASLDEQERWRKFTRLSRRRPKFMRFLIPPGQRVLELGAHRDLLAR